MWRYLRLSNPRNRIFSSKKPGSIRFQRSYSNSSSTSGKLFFGVAAAAGGGLIGAVVYGNYDPKFRKVLKENVPYIEYLYKLFPSEDQKPSITSHTTRDEKVKDTMSTSPLKKKLEREKTPTKEISADSKSKESTTHNSDPKFLESNVNNSEPKPPELNVELLQTEEIEHASNGNAVLSLVEKLLKSSDDARIAYKNAVKAVKQHTQTVYEALDLSESTDGDIVWKDVKKANLEKSSALNSAEDMASKTKVIMEKLIVSVNKVLQEDKNNPVIQTAEESLCRVEKQLQRAQAEIAAIETEARTAEQYQKLVNTSKEQFRREIEVVLPNYIYGDKDKNLAETDLNLLIAHAHRRIEKLQKQLARQQVTEKMKVDEAVRLQKLKDSNLIESKIEAELQKRHVNLEIAIEERVALLKDNFESELRHQLHRQAAAHGDHIREVSKLQEQELERQYSLDLEEKLLHQKGVFISEVSGNMARLKGILDFLKAKKEFDSASKKAQALWLACQSMSCKITAESTLNPLPLGKDIAAVKIAADGDSEFISSVLAGIPAEAVNRGVFSSEVLKDRFQDVKKVCRRVAMIDENNDSLYRYLLSYLQSFLVIDAVSIPKAELEGKVAVDPSEWDTFSVLSRISYCLKINDLEQALRYANQLRGEPRVVAKGWMNEVKLHLEAQLAVKALLAHAAAIGVQAYH